LTQRRYDVRTAQGKPRVDAETRLSVEDKPF